MVGLFLSEAILFVIFVLAGFALGWRINAHFAAERVRELENDIETLRAAWSDAQVRRAAKGS